MRKAGVDIADHYYERAAQYLEWVGAIRDIDAWVAEDKQANVKGPGGAPEFLPDRAVLITTLACAFAHAPTSYTQITYALTAPAMTRHLRKILGLPMSKNRALDQRLNATRRGMHRSTIGRHAAQIAATFDPRVYPTDRGYTDEELKLIDDARDAADEAKRQNRADDLAHRMLTTAWKMLPAEVQDSWAGGITFDATPIRIYGQKGHYDRRRKVEGANSPEANAGIYDKTPDKRDAAAQPGATLSKNRKFAAEAHLGRNTSPGVGIDFPAQVAALRLERPGVAPGHNAHGALQGIPRAGMPVGLLTVDRGYSQQTEDNFAGPMRALGYGLVMDYRDDALGIQETFKGCLLIDGWWYGPCIPEKLKWISVEWRAGRLDDDTYHRQIQERMKYALRFKETKRGDMVFVFRCPGRGHGRTLDCAHVAEFGSAQPPLPAGRKKLPLAVKRPKQALEVCKLKQSISIPADLGLRFRQDIPYRSPEWYAAYTGPRNEIESENKRLKKATGAAIDEVAHRQFRGWGKQLLAIMCKIVAANLDSIRDWADSDPTNGDPNEKQQTRRGRKPKYTGFSKYGTEPGDAPLRTPGRRPPEKRAA
ncbi:hypothetical protein QQX10_10555 [Demequina sp. SYSU T00039]|uniref:Transposase DDE domain-containing protein n=2 Tax=Demequina lignilytica TaxID=3051663 RepID=A0AAW7M4B9_9MICO|nr:hypothetical protein [Demequina sp. SYSU T00039]MDN4488607.1 hypothetical protein [Demequina sp. SYSU T00039]